MKKTYLAALCAGVIAASCAVGSASAHGVFFANRLDQKALVLGEGPGDNAYKPSCVTAVDAYDKNFSSMNIETVTYKDHVAIKPSEDLGVTVTLRKGDTYRIRVYKNGQPYANAPLIKDVINDLTNESTADKDGYATVTVSANGLNVVGVEVAGDKEDEHTTPKYFSSLSFIIDPE